MYAKLFSSITESSLWSDTKEVRLLFVSMLAKADQDGFVDAAIPGLARISNLTIDEVEEALVVLESPDKYSKNPNAEGRRIARVPGGFVIINYQDYRARRDMEERREYMRKYMANYRKQDVNVHKQTVNTVSHSKPPLAHTEAEAEAEADTESEVKKERESKTKTNSLALPHSDEFEEIWTRWKQHLNEIFKPLKPSAEDAQLMELVRCFPDEADRIAAVAYSIARQAKNLITNGDHKQRAGPKSADKSRHKTTAELMRGD